MHTIQIEPLGQGWAVHVTGIHNPMVFRDSRIAASAARLLAAKLDAATIPSLVSIGGTIRSIHHDPKWRPNVR